MSRIAQDAHAAIRRSVEAEGHSIVEVAATYGCSPANIYRILKLQRQDVANEDGDAPVSTFAWVQRRIANQTTPDLCAALDRLQNQFDRHMDLLLRVVDRPDQHDAEAQQQWRNALDDLRLGRADGMAGHTRISMALAREIQRKTAELHLRHGAGRAG